MTAAPRFSDIPGVLSRLYELVLKTAFGEEQGLAPVLEPRAGGVPRRGFGVSLKPGFCLWGFPGAPGSGAVLIDW